MRLFGFLVIILAVGTVQVYGTEDPSHVPGSSSTPALLQQLNKLLGSLGHLQNQASTPEDHLRLNRVSEVIQAVTFRLTNGRIYEKSPHELLLKLKEEIRLASPQEIDTKFEDEFVMLLQETSAWGSTNSSTPDDCTGIPPSTPELVLSELNELRCTKGGEFYDVLGCVGAATLYCHKAFPHKSNSELLGLVTNRKGNALTVACLERSGLIFAGAAGHYQAHMRMGDEQQGTGKVCELHHGSEHAGIYADRVSTNTLGEYEGIVFMAGCFRAVKRAAVRYSDLQAYAKDCRAGNAVRNYDCFKAASSYCSGLGYTGGIVQFYHSLEVAEVACYNAFYTGDVYISRDADFQEAKNSLGKVCSLDYDINNGKILQAAPDTIQSGVFDNRRSSVELRDIFRVEKTVTTQNEFSHSHSFTIEAELTVKTQVPLVLEKQIRISASYTGGVSLTKTNTQTTQFSHTSEVFVPPRMGVVKKAVVTRSNMDVPWRAVGITGLGRRVEISGTWRGVDVSSIRTEQEDL